MSANLKKLVFWEKGNLNLHLNLLATFHKTFHNLICIDFNCVLNCVIIKLHRGSCDLVLMILSDISRHNSHFSGKSLSSHHFAWRHEVCALNQSSYITFNLLRKFNFHVTSMNTKFKFLARSLKKYSYDKMIGQYDKIQNIRVFTKYKTL